jgi:aquaporin Z
VKYINEIIGTFFLVFTIGMTVLEPHSAGNLAPLAIASALIFVIYAGGHISGAHYNPAVSWALFLRGKMSPLELLGYWIAQLIGGAKAAFVVIYFKGNTAAAAMNIDIPKALLAEFIFTLALCFVVLTVATAKKTAGNHYFGLAIGLVIVAGAYSVGPISGGAFNPAVALGAVIMNLGSLSNLWVYIVANLLGASAAALIFRFTEAKA